jgi:hypothetical protein
MKLRDPIRRWIGDNSPRGALDSGHTIAEIEDDLDRREEVLRNIESKVDSHSQEKKQYLEKAVGADARKKMRFYAKAQEAGMYRSFYSELWENLMIQQFFLIKLSLEAKRRRLLVDATGELPIEIDIGELNADAIRNALEDSSLEQDDVEDTIEMVDMHFDRDSASDLQLDLDEIRSEAEELEAAEIGSGEAELGSEMKSHIDDQVEKELARMEEEV